MTLASQVKESNKTSEELVGTMTPGSKEEASAILDIVGPHTAEKDIDAHAGSSGRRKIAQKKEKQEDPMKEVRTCIQLLGAYTVTSCARTAGPSALAIPFFSDGAWASSLQCWACVVRL